MKKAASLCLVLGVLLYGNAIAEAADGGVYDSNGTVNFMPGTDPTNPVDPTNPDPDKPVNPVDPTNPDGPNPGTEGPLSIDYASSFDFGLNKISNKTETYYARAQTYKDNADNSKLSNLVTPNYVQVSDNRGTNGGWTLTLKQNGQFKNDNTLNKELTGSVLKLTDPTVKSNTQGITPPAANKEIALDPTGKESVVFSAAKNAGAGTWVDAWGKTEQVTEKNEANKDVAANITKAVALTVPGSTPKDAVSYATTLTWSLSDVPANQ